MLDSTQRATAAELLWAAERDLARILFPVDASRHRAVLIRPFIKPWVASRPFRVHVAMPAR